MLFRNKRRRHGVMIVGLVGLMLLLAAVVVSPALANTFHLERFRADPQSVTVEDASGTHRAILYADLNGLPDGTVSGPMTLQVGETTYDFAFNEVEEIRFGENGQPSGIALRGRGTMKQGEVVQQLYNLELNTQLGADDAPPIPIFEITSDCVLDSSIIGALIEVTFGGGE